MKNLEAYEVQIMVTDANGDEFKFQVDDSNYFYPASSVKLPVALLALETANNYDDFDSRTMFQVEGDSVQTNIRREITKIFAVSDNDAYNRLFELMGQFEINTRLIYNKKLTPVRISHRVGTTNAAALKTKPVTILKNDTAQFKRIVIKSSPIKSLELNRIQKGKGFYRNDTLVSKPMDFSKKNYLPIATLHQLMHRLHHPEKYNPKVLFELSESDRNFLLEAMHKTPKQQGFTDPEYYDSYVKFFMFGDSKEPMPEHIKIYNKVGYAYGYLTDCAHIIDTKNDVSFTITATIHVNKNQIFNDDTYEYDEIGIPFLAELGRQVHQFYLNKKQQK
ncbi:serine hydrolase [Kordia algicida OT-1]|nr:serine hydrolase [Kordia algicida]